ncbi:hypothetical protein HPP92_023842 [Vanilla planifolia]|uniref:BTB domain-containing protein n=1 Tax=Vanilla planifolia TaxID=51239 RepID=A0A835UAS4_VANPL|nr:hypothetical protein HPP92_023842 [Vanilla planifolia]
MCPPARYDDLVNPHDPLPEPQFKAGDVSIVASSGQRFPANSFVLASASPVLEKMLSLPQKRGSLGRAIPILGVSDEVVLDFLRLLFGAGLGSELSDGERHAPAILALSHAYSVGWLKERCEAALCRRVGPEDAVDVMNLAKLCDAPRLSLRCFAVAAKNFNIVQRSEGWRFVQEYDPRLELEVLQFIQETEQRRRRWRRRGRTRRCSGSSAKPSAVWSTFAPRAAPRSGLTTASRRAEAGALPRLPYVQGPTAPHPPFRKVREEGGRRRWVHPLPADVAALPPPFFPLRCRRRRLQGSPLQAIQGEDRERRGEGEGGGRDVEAPCEEGEAGEGYVYRGIEEDAGTASQVVGKL